MDDPLCFFEKFWDLLQDKQFDFLTTKCLEFLHNYVKARINSSNKSSYHPHSQDRQKIEICRQKLNEIIKSLNNNDRGCGDRNLFLQRFPKWKKGREDIISKFEKIVKSLNTEKKILNVAKMTGGAIGIAGGAAIITSIVAPPFGIVGGIATWLSGTALGAFVPASLLPSAVATSWAVGGGIAAAVGGGTHLTASISGEVLLNKHMKEAVKLIEKEKEDFRDMEDWFKHSKTLIENLNEIVEFSIFKKVVKDFQTVIRNLRNIQSQQSLLKNVFSKIFDKIVFKLMIPVEFQIATAGILLAVSLIFKRNGILSVSLDDAINLVSAFKIINVGIGYSSLNVAVGVKAGAVGVRNATRALRAIAAVGIALDAATIVLSAIDLSKGSVSEEGKLLTEVTEALQEEVDVLEQAQEILLKSTVNEIIEKRYKHIIKYMEMQQKYVGQIIIEKCNNICKNWQESKNTNLQDFERNFQISTKQSLQSLYILYKYFMRAKELYNNRFDSSKKFFILEVQQEISKFLQTFSKGCYKIRELNNIAENEDFKRASICLQKNSKEDRHFQDTENFLKKEIKRMEDEKEKIETSILDDLFWSSQRSISSNNPNSI